MRQLPRAAESPLFSRTMPPFAFISTMQHGDDPGDPPGPAEFPNMRDDMNGGFTPSLENAPTQSDAAAAPETQPEESDDEEVDVFEMIEFVPEGETQHEEDSEEPTSRRAPAKRAKRTRRAPVRGKKSQRARVGRPRSPQKKASKKRRGRPPASKKKPVRRRARRGPGRPPKRGRPARRERRA